MNDSFESIEKNKIKCVLYISSAPTTLREAKKILELVKQHPEIEGSLLACVIILLAAALEQFTLTRLKDAAKNISLMENIHIEKTEPHVLSNNSLRKRIINTPSVLTAGKYLINRKSKHTVLLHELVDLRNQLVHIQEDPVEISGDSNNFSIEGDKIIISDLSLPKFPWTDLKLKEVTKIYEAVEIYFNEVLNKAIDEICSGEIVSEYFKKIEFMERK